MHHNGESLCEHGDLQQNAGGFIHGDERTRTMAEKATNRWMQVEEGGSMEQFRARCVSGVSPAVVLGSDDFLGAGSLRRLRRVRGCERTGERKKKTCPLRSPIYRPGVVTGALTRLFRRDSRIACTRITLWPSVWVCSDGHTNELQNCKGH